MSIRYPNANYPTAYVEGVMHKATDVLVNAPVLEQQKVSHDGDGGTFTLSFGGNTTAAIAWDAAASLVKTRLEALASINSVTVSGAGTVANPWLVTFIDPGGDVALMTGNGASLTNVTVGLVITAVGQGRKAALSVTEAAPGKGPL